MRNILVPIDFSENSRNALNYAIHLANVLDADIHLSHIFHVPNKVGTFVATQEKMRASAKKELLEWADTHKEHLKDNLDLKCHILKDNVAKGIAHLGRKYKADLIIMGTKGISNLKNAIWGSIASNVIRQTSIPVLAIPQYYNEFKFDHILFAIDNPTFDHKKTLGPLLEIKKRTRAKVTSFNMAVPITIPHNGKEDYLTTSDLIENLSDDYHQSFDHNLKKSIVQYSLKNNVDLICMMRKDRGFFIDLMHSSETQKVIFDTPVPLLILHYRER